MLVAALTIAMLLTIWFKTNALVEYCNVFKISKLFRWVTEFNMVRADFPAMLFVDFIAEHQSSFLSRLLTCPICVSTWLGMFSLIFLPLSFCLPAAFLGLLFYLLLGKLQTNA